MDELIQTIAEKTGLPADQAQKAAEAVIGFLKEKLPEPIAGQLEGLLSGGGASGGGLGGITDTLKGMFGN